MGLGDAIGGLAGGLAGGLKERQSGGTIVDRVKRLFSKKVSTSADTMGTSTDTMGSPGDTGPIHGDERPIPVRKGGRIQKTGVYLVHKGEVVIPAKLAARIGKGRKASRKAGRGGRR